MSRVDTGRVGLASLVIGALLLGFIALTGIPAQASQHNDQGGNPPSVECASPLWNGDYWKVQVNNGSLGTVESNVSSDAISPISLVSGTVTWENNHSDPVFRIVRKSGQSTSANIEGMWAPGEGDSFTVPSDISHITFCFTDPTTTTEGTTTTTEGTTTTTEGTTTTTEGTTTTTEGTTTTTEGTTTTTEGTTTTTEGTTTTTEATTTTSSIPDEVLGTVVTTTTADVSPSTLPFTGGESETLAMVAMVLIAGGLLTLIGAKAVERRQGA